MRTVSGAIYDAQVTRHFLTGEELTGDELTRLLERAAELKADRQASDALTGRSVALIFEKPSTRTRISFEVGINELGGHAVVLREGEMQLSRGESVRDTALVLSRYVAAIGVRTGPHAPVVELAEHASVPVVNMLTADHHPCQALADLLTLKERFGRLEGLKLAYVGDGNNVAHSLMIIAPRVGVEVAVATPAELAPQPFGSAEVLTDPAEAVRGRERGVHGRLAQHGRRGRGGQARAARALPARRGAARRARPTTRSRSTAFPRTSTRRSRPVSCTARGRRCGTRRRTACTPRRPSLSCWSPGRLRGMKKLLVLLIACLALTLAACGDDDDDDAGSPSAPTTPTETTAPPSAKNGGTATVDIPEIAFDPADITVKAGTTVTWTNSDDIPHTVTKDGGPGADFDSGDLDPGSEFEQTFEEKGTVDYVCTIHPGQAGTVTVE